MSYHYYLFKNLLNSVKAPWYELLILECLKLKQKLQFDRLNPFPMIKFKYVFSLLILTLLSFAVKAQTESQTKYYRYFTVEVENISQAEFDQLSASRESNNHLQFEEICPIKELVLVTYDASVPKRIDDMEAEIKGALSAQFPSKEISNVETLVYSDKTNFCND